jgi:L-aspartate semialdehyde sulfurtransferase
MAKTIAEINEKIRKGQAVVVNAEEIIDIVEEDGPQKAAEQVDVVTTGTFGPMCSSGALLNIPHTSPKIRMQKAWLNNISAYAGIAAVDFYIGATEIPENDPANQIFPGEFRYGGGHLIEDLVTGKPLFLRAISYGTDCYPRKEYEAWITINDLRSATLMNPRNCYQNYNVAVNRDAERTIYTYLGVLRPNLGNANYSSAGELSPLLNDPLYRTIGLGTRIFLGGGVGYVAWEGTQHDPDELRGDNDVPRRGAGTLTLMGDLKQMSPEWLRGTSITGYGASLTVGIGIPIPVLNEEIVRYTAVKDADIYAAVVDYSTDYPQARQNVLAEVSYQELKSGAIQLNGKEVATASMSSYAKAREIANILKDWIQQGEFELTQPVRPLRGPGE